MDNDIKLQILDGSETGHKCQMGRHLEDVAHELDETKRTLEIIRMENQSEFRKIWFKMGFIMLACSLLLATVYGARFSIDWI